MNNMTRTPTNSTILRTPANSTVLRTPVNSTVLHSSQITFDNPTIADLTTTNYNSNQLSYHYQLHE